MNQNELIEQLSDWIKKKQKRGAIGTTHVFIGDWKTIR